MANDQDFDDYKPEGAQNGAVTIDLDAKDGDDAIVEKPDVKVEEAEAEPEQHDDGDESEAEPEKPREKKRWLTTKEKRERAKVERERDRATIQALEARLNEVNTRLAEVQGNFRGLNEQSVEKEINAAANAYHAAKAEIARKAASGEDFTADLEAMNAARDRHRDMTVMKERASKAPQSPQPSPSDAVAMTKAQQWISRNSWFRAPPPGQGAADMDSAIALTVDAQLRREGFNPATDVYYEELDKRLKRHLPHLHQDDDESEAPKPKNGARGGPQVNGGVRQTNGQGNGKTFTFTPQQLAVIKAGGHDTSDPAVLKSFAQEYIKHAKEQAAKGRRIMA